MNDRKVNVEEQLSAVLGRTDPPAGFTDRVLDGIREDRASSVRHPGRAANRWARIAAAALLIVSTGLLSSHYVMEVRAEVAGEQAKRELMLAMKIASEKANLARQEVLSIGSERDNEKGDQQ